MFGHGWEPGRAVIVARKNIPRNSTTSSEEFIVDVQPAAGGPAFRAVFRGPLSSTGFRAPEVGAVVPVWCDVKHGKVRFDLTDPALRWDTGIRAEAAHFDAVLHGAPGGVAAPPVDTSGRPTDAELRAVDEAFRAALHSGRAAMDAFRVAQQSGDTEEAARLHLEITTGNAEVQRLNAEYQRLSALQARWRGGGRPTGGVPAGPAGDVPADPLDRLGKLADLHDRGVLTDAEFAAEKAKILHPG